MKTVLGRLWEIILVAKLGIFNSVLISVSKRKSQCIIAGLFASKNLPKGTSGYAVVRATDLEPVVGKETSHRIYNKDITVSLPF